MDSKAKGGFLMDFDHLVVAAKLPEQAKKDMNMKHGVVGVKGGEHNAWGTYNHLAFFNNQAYIEWLGVQDYDTALNSGNPLIQHLMHNHEQDVEGPITFALRTSDMDSLIEYWDEERIDYEGPFEGSRTKPSGSTLSWRMLFPKFDFESKVLPFVIEWADGINSADNPEDTNSIPFNTIHVGVDELEKAKEEWMHLYQLGEPTPSTDLAGNPSYDWKLGNGTLSLSKGEGINAKFGNINI